MTRATSAVPRAVPAAPSSRAPATAPLSGRAFRLALVLLPIGVLGNIAYTLLATDRALLAALGSLPRGYLVAALALTLTPWFTGTVRLWIWTRFLDYRIPLRDLFRMTLVVDLGAALSPTAIGGEAFRWGMLLRHGVAPGTAASITLLPKLEDAVFFAVALPVAIVWTRAWELPLVMAGVRAMTGNALVAIVAVIAVVVLIRVLAGAALRGRAGPRARRRGLRAWGRTRRRLRKAAREGRAVFHLVARRGRLRFAGSMVFTALHWGARYSVIAALALFLGVPFDPVLFWLLQWVVFTIMSFIPTPGAAGGAELAFTAVYATLLPAGAIGIATAAWRLFTFYVPVALAAIVFVLTGISPAAVARAATTSES